MKNYSNEIAELETLITGIKKESFELGQSNNLKVQSVFDSHFNKSKQFTIKVSGDSAYFTVKDEEGCLNDLFSIYFHERYRQERELELSYYTTSTQSQFQLERLISLGKVATILRDNCEQIVRDINEVRKEDIGRSNELFSIQNGYEKKKAEYVKAAQESRKVEIELSLKGDGVTFEQPVYIKFKRNYTVRANSIKITEVSKSGKTCTVIYSTRDGFQTREENCNVENILNQVVYSHNNIVQELLPA